MEREDSHTEDGLLVALAWPDAWCRNSGAWYDGLLENIGFSKDGASPVGHAALMLVNRENGKAEYFDCGRYGEAKDLAIVRNAQDFPELELEERVRFDRYGKPLNLNSLLQEIQDFPYLEDYKRLEYHSYPVNHAACRSKIESEIKDGPKVYGPFHLEGSNCARFVMKALIAGEEKPEMAKLKYFPSPSPGKLVQLNTTKKLWSRLMQSTLSAITPPVFEKASSS